MNLFDGPVAEPVGDALDRYYTPQPIANQVCRQVAHMLADCGLAPPRILEPSVGGGAFVRAMRSHILCEIHGNDIDPSAAGLALCDTSSLLDFPRSRWSTGKYDAVVGNPPFDVEKPGATTIEHVRMALSVANIVALILPWSYGCQTSWADTLSPRNGFLGIQPIHPRPWNNHREAAVYFWYGGGTRKDRLFMPPLEWKSLTRKTPPE